MRLTNPANTANITVADSTTWITNDLSTNLGGGAFGALGTGTITLGGPTLAIRRPDGDVGQAADPGAAPAPFGSSTRART